MPEGRGIIDMITAKYRIRIEALTESDEVICAMEQTIAQSTLSKSRPRQLIRFIEVMIRDFLRGHREAEKRLVARQKRAQQRMPRPRIKQFGLQGLLEQHDNHA
jgi:hypothetical protein